jgi:hypothetical protein
VWRGAALALHWSVRGPAKFDTLNHAPRSTQRNPEEPYGTPTGSFRFARAPMRAVSPRCAAERASPRPVNRLYDAGATHHTSHCRRDLCDFVWNQARIGDALPARPLALSGSGSGLDAEHRTNAIWTTRSGSISPRRPGCGSRPVGILPTPTRPRTVPSATSHSSKRPRATRGGAAHSRPWRRACATASRWIRRTSWRRESNSDSGSERPSWAFRTKT